MAEPDLGFLTGSLGPLPTWAWGLIGAGAFLLFKHLHSSSVATPAVVTQAIPVQGSGTNTIPSGSSGSSGSSYSGSGLSPLQNWLSQAQSFIGQLGVPSSASNLALQNYLSGQQLDQGEYNIISEIQSLVGAAPGVAPAQLMSTTSGSTGASGSTTGGSGSSGSLGGGAGATQGTATQSNSTPLKFSNPTIKAGVSDLPGTSITQSQQNIYVAAVDAALNKGVSYGQAQLSGYAAEKVNPYPSGTTQNTSFQQTISQPSTQSSNDAQLTYNNLIAAGYTPSGALQVTKNSYPTFSG